MTPDEIVAEIFRIQMERDPDTDPGDLTLTIDIQDDSALHIVAQQYSLESMSDPFLGVGESIQRALEAALEKVRSQ
jgi:hypothetical protein